MLDATGKALTLTNKTVAPTTGAYGPITLGTALPYRVEACGTVAERPVCLWAATNVGGTLNLTPLTSAITVLASGQSPETLMTGAAQRLTDTDIAAAHAQVRAAVAPALAEAGLAADFDLLAGALTPGSHTGQDRVLDSVAVTLGTEAKAYAALGARFGSGVAYLEPGAAQEGALSFDATATAALDLSGLDALYTTLGTALSVKDTCQTELTKPFDAGGRATAYTSSPTGVETVTGNSGERAAQLLCLVMGGVLGDYGVLFGNGKLLPPVLGRCELGTGDPLCRVSFTFQTTKGVLRPLGIEQAAVKRADGWKFLGNRLEVPATAAARLVLSRRADSPAPDAYRRFIDIRIPIVGGLQCARASQHDTLGANVPLALFKRPTSGRYLSLWSVSSSNAAPSLNPASGALRGADLVAVPVANDAAGDTTARNFLRAGRALKIELFSDSACSTPLAGADGGTLSVDVAGQLPLSTAAMSGQPWPVLAAASVKSLIGLVGTANAAVSFTPQWTFPRGDVALHRAQLCALDPACSNKLAELELPGTATTAAMSGSAGALGLLAIDYKLLRLIGRNADGLLLQLDTAACTGQASGQPC